MALAKGTLALIDYSSSIKETGEVFDTTRGGGSGKDAAPRRLRLVSIGDPSFPPPAGIEERLAGAAAGDRFTIDAPPEQAFGQVNKKKVRALPTRKLGEEADRCVVGDTVEIDERKGVIKFMSSGRVTVDFNHRYAGKTVTHEVHVVNVLETDDDKIGGILRHFFSDPKVAFKRVGDTVLVRIPQSVIREENLANTKNLEIGRAHV